MGGDIMSEILLEGYQSIRDYIQNNWSYLELRDMSDASIVRLKIDTDPRASWTHLQGSQTLEITVVIKGSDADIGTLPKVFNSTAIFKDAIGGDPCSVELFNPNFTMASSEDQLTIKHRIQVPKIIT